MLILDYENSCEDIARLEKEIFKFSSYSKKEIEEMLENKSMYKFISAKEDGKILGYIIIFDNSESLEIMKIGVIPEARKRGIGTLLIKEMKKMEKDIFLEVRENNMTAISFYKENFFVEVGKRKNYYKDTGEAAIIMCWNR
ncbi:MULTISPECIES: ribosomal protein S18-alanine N-acetyltransferase [Fusobacterium]|uniref:ribosomal protein S18-alanine N-acetyltransferase n=1 Tax=Fusobacterium TaxID=848 RepID=UPI00047FCED8|nr:MULTISPECIES: ribosomal protein S18-alanine N-acetyltransferase [Fusobacterium]MCI6151714.1 ribosomal protein S18-alanine N-acetyltransferase [Fusobacterium perfoetens]MDY3237830.1 ribosomal protein S18-alanine N-acetyltransferase [Fusobacterium perfoetens]NME36854.1 ribosomal protein S18-alanine N-acetyltransferase [Fusobacterium sp. FSA-380-WT-3A]